MLFDIKNYLKSRKNSKIWKVDFFAIFIPSFLAILALFANNMRNNAYLPLYQILSIPENNNNLLFCYIYLVLSNFFSYMTGWVLIVFYVYIGYLARNHVFINNSCRSSSLAQNIVYNQYYVVQYFYLSVYNFVYGVSNTCFFLLKMFYKYHDFEVVLCVFLVLVIFLVLILIFMYLIHVFQIYYTRSYGSLMEFYNKLALKSVIRANINLGLIKKNHFDLMQSTLWLLLIPGFLEFVNTSVAPISYLIFFKSYCLKIYSYGDFMQINNMFANIIFAIMSILNGFLDFGKFKAVYNELLNIDFDREYLIGDYVVCVGQVFFNKNIANVVKETNSVVRGKKYDFNLDVKKNKRSYLYAPNGMGKSLLVQSFVFGNEFQAVSRLMLPKNTIIIPEHAKFFAIEIQPEQKSIFLENYNLLKPSLEMNIHSLDEMLEKFEYLNMETRWKLIAAYALLFDFFIWDDPFWGVEDSDESFKNFFKTVDRCLILSARKFDPQIFKEFSCIYLKDYCCDM